MPFASWEDFIHSFGAKFFHVLIEMRMMNELQSQIWKNDDSFIQHIRNMQELMLQAIADASEVANVAGMMRQCHSQNGTYLHICTYGTLKELARELRGIEEHIVSEHEYLSPPPPESTLETSCAYQSSPMRANPIGGPPTVADSPCTSAAFANS